ncbi:hypothetical protein BRADI_3g28642v3 [Brachypodium distachyon]|uniref:Zinc finger PMZ-type domain-containing protein n=1 Tax=Brachypodium distachyon TaxID=15368 RepID=A0A0Q3FCV9_BRADI|nr:hypothetical protein BRADI_3g28642v3 [Brachypodium distachyon]
MVITLKDGTWLVTSLDMQHNHELSPHGEAKYLRSHKHMTNVEKLFIRTFNSVKLPTRKIMAILSYLRGGIHATPYTKKILSNMRTSIRKETKANDMMMVLQYFRKRQDHDPRFYYAFKVDSSKKVENIFWSDGNSRRFYELYGDCISFDTTYKTNRYNLPFAPFVGITGHAHNCLFACAILHDETIETFTWLFDTFLHCMGGKKPVTIIADQDVAMKQAIPIVFTGTKHRNCLFHIKKKAEEKCARCFATKPTLHEDFSDIVNKCFTETEFETLWPEMIVRHKLEDIKYFKQMWDMRKNFVPVYFKKDFFPFIHSTARSEDTNAVFKDNVGLTYSVISFLSEYQRISEDIMEKEREQDSLTRTTRPTMWVGSAIELQAAKKYNRSIFYKFQAQLKLTPKLHVLEVEKNLKYDVYKSKILADKDFRQRKFVVMVDWLNEDISCICQKFLKDGIVFCHVLKVLDFLNISELPDKYYIDRWMPKETKYTRDIEHNMPFIEVASDGSVCNERYMYLLGEIKRIRQQLNTMPGKEHTQQQAEGAGSARTGDGEVVSENTTVVQPDMILADPDVAKSKGRPKTARRHKTIMEIVLTKQ